MYNFLNLSVLIITCIRIRRNQPFANPNVQLLLSNVSLAFHSYEFQQHHTRQCYLVECCRIWNKYHFVVLKSIVIRLQNIFNIFGKFFFTYLLPRKMQIGRLITERIHCPHNTNITSMENCIHNFGVFHWKICYVSSLISIVHTSNA